MLLDVGQFREHVTTSLGDDAVQRLLDAAEAAIVSRIGAAGARTERANGGYRTIAVGHRVDSISAVTETIGTTTTTLNANDYRLRPDSYTLERLATGANPRWYWFGAVEVTYSPIDDEPLRIDVQIDLCRLALNYTPGETMEQIGSWTVQRVASAVWNNETERDAILARLDPSPGAIVVGASDWVSAW